MSGQARSGRSHDLQSHGERSFEALIACLEGVTSSSIDAPADPEGEWLFDVSIEGFATSVAWRHDRGYGIFSSEIEGFGDRPNEIFRDPCLAARRLGQLVDAARNKRSPKMRLSDVRRLVNEPQLALAGRLQVGQGVISRLENRHDAKISTICQYVEALGGRAELLVRFDDFEAPIDILLGDHPGDKPLQIQTTVRT